MSSIAAAACGSFSGSIAAAATTPLDVAKTRIMIGTVGSLYSHFKSWRTVNFILLYLQDTQGRKYSGLIQTLNRVYAEGGNKALFAGIQPRVMWISIGGFVFFGAYEFCKSSLMKI